MRRPREIKIINGVYLLVWRQFNSDTIGWGTVYYIGQANNILQRYASHRRSFFGRAQQRSMPRIVLLRELATHSTKTQLLEAERRFLLAAGDLKLTLTNTSKPAREHRLRITDLAPEIKCLRVTLTILKDPEFDSEDVKDVKYRV
jgi:hypothetical protein